jgi:hypothetical protein
MPVIKTFAVATNVINSAKVKKIFNLQVNRNSIIEN